MLENEWIIKQSEHFPSQLDCVTHADAHTHPEYRSLLYLAIVLGGRIIIAFLIAVIRYNNIIIPAMLRPLSTIESPLSLGSSYEHALSLPSSLSLAPSHTHTPDLARSTEHQLTAGPWILGMSNEIFVRHYSH